MEKQLYRLWIVLLAVTGGIACWFVAVASMGLWNYFSMSETALATITHVQIKELSSSRFALETAYQYTVKGTEYSVQTVLRSPQFLNRFTAENELPAWKGRQCRVFYQKKNPKKSRLEKSFPTKQCLHAILTCGVLGYFYISRHLFSSASFQKYLK